MNLEKLNLVELSPYEVQKTQGGAWWIPVVSLLAAMINDAQNNPDDFNAGVDAAPNPYNL
ncbi:hypothetical protein pgond44_00910 [Psychroflexus gondwanensis ACAM 44]|jgi:uncharacterized protein (DUF2461 family)|uniref:Uncharacterized protein n=1 Tax=Psychroflexus gondwanensis ACAM 44 TaxID=1189619 RepID=N1WUD9_9FLAO|nr:hypothetical protein [Psychroflexus gondwanensis]EMY82640.1 hypothetical protein pgond44_00910 [Psychroflexus gondwanensis ACAM 44]